MTTSEFNVWEAAMVLAWTEKKFSGIPLDRRIENATQEDIDRQFAALLEKTSWREDPMTLNWANGTEKIGSKNTITARMTFGNRLYNEPSVSSEESSDDNRDRFKSGTVKASREKRVGDARAAALYVGHRTNFVPKKSASGKKGWRHKFSNQLMTDEHWAEVRGASRAAVDTHGYETGPDVSTQAIEAKPKTRGGYQDVYCSRS
jgi:hypothetical protein